MDFEMDLVGSQSRAAIDLSVLALISSFSFFISLEIRLLPPLVFRNFEVLIFFSFSLALLSQPNFFTIRGLC